MKIREKQMKAKRSQTLVDRHCEILIVSTWASEWG